MTKVINIVSPSGGGKTTIAKRLSKKYGYNVIQSYTTRPKRYEGEYGHTFVEGWLDEGNLGVFTVSGNITGLIPWSNMIAYFNSYSSGNHYFATDEQVLRGEVNLYIVDPEGAKQVHEYYKDSDVKVLTIFIQADESVRAERLVRRVNNGYCFTPKDNPEVWSRIRPDRKIFESIKCDYTINGNKTLDKVTELVYDVISGE